MLQDSPRRLVFKVHEEVIQAVRGELYCHQQSYSAFSFVPSIISQAKYSHLCNSGIIIEGNQQLSDWI